MRSLFGSRFWKNFDWLLFGVTLCLVAISLLIIYAASFKASGIATITDVWHQAIFAVIGLGAFYATARIDYRVWAKLTPWLYSICIILLVTVLVVSHAVLGASRWIDVGFFQFQPSEFTKLVLIIVLAKFFSNHYDQMDRPRYLFMSLGYLVVPMALVLKQPDLGTALVLVVIWLAMVLVSPVRKIYLGLLAAAAVACLPIGIRFLKPYQRARLDTFFNPLADPLQTGYNAVQSTITVGSGQLFGRGLEAGSQTQLNFLPSLAQHTDFIFAVLSEKMGFIGGALLLVLYGFQLARGLIIGYRSQDRFGFFIATGIVAMLAFHLFINIGMNMGIAPVTGIPLPFISYGGTSLIIGLACIGLLESIAIRHKKLQFEG